LADRIACHVLKHTDSDFKEYSFLERGSDERQYCAPGVDLPVATIMRSKFGEYPEYHTSHDDLKMVTPKGLRGGYEALRRSIKILENNYRLKTTTLGEPNLGKRGIYPTLSGPVKREEVRDMMNVLAFSDKNRLLEIANKIERPAWKIYHVADKLIEKGLLKKS
jgi:aminopeptidase-like protein